MQESERSRDGTAASRRPMAVALALAITAGGCATQPAVYESLGEVVGEPQFVSATVAQVTGSPEQYVSRVVTVSGEVNRVFGQRWFTIGGEEFGGDELLVLAPMSAPALVTTLADSARVMNDIVQVTGVVRLFEEDALEREIGGIDLDGDIFDPFDAHPVIVMADLATTPRVDPGGAAVSHVIVSVPIVREAEIIVADRAVLDGRAAALYDVRVDSVLGPRALRIGRGNRGIIVVLNDSGSVGAVGQPTTATLRAGQNVFVAGVLRRVPMDVTELRRTHRIEAATEAALRGETLYLDAYRVESIGSIGRDR